MPVESDLVESFVFGQGWIKIPLLARLFDFAIWNEWFTEVSYCDVIYKCRKYIKLKEKFWSWSAFLVLVHIFGFGPHFCQQNKHIPFKKDDNTDHMQSCQLFLECFAC